MRLAENKNPNLRGTRVRIYRLTYIKKSSKPHGEIVDAIIYIYIHIYRLILTGDISTLNIKSLIFQFPRKMPIISIFQENAYHLNFPRKCLLFQFA